MAGTEVSAYQVTRLRKAGNLAEALPMAEQLLAGSPENVWNIRALGWVLLDLLKEEDSEVTELGAILKRLAALPLASGEELFYNQFRWRLGTVLYRCKGDNAAVYEGVVTELLLKMPSQPGEAHSFLLKSILKLQQFWTDVPSLINAWGCRNFAVNDWHRETLPGGRKGSSLVERTYIALSKWLLDKDDERGRKVADEMLELTKQEYEWKYLGYYCALLLKKQNRIGEARSVLLSYARKNRNLFWVWDLLAGLTEGEMSRACLIRAVSCKVPEEFLVKTRQKLAAAWIATGHWEEAAYEVTLLQKARHAKGWPVPEQVKRWIAHPAFPSPNGDVPTQYTFLSKLAESCLLEESRVVEGVIVGVNEARQTVQFYVSVEVNGGFKMKEGGVRFEVGQSVKLWLEERSGSNGNYWHADHIRLSDHVPSEDQVRSFSGMIRRTGAIGFVSGVMVPAQLLGQASPDWPVEGTAIRSYDAKRQKWGWKAFSIADVEKKFG